VRIHYLAPHEPSGYATSAHRHMRALIGAGAELRWIPLVPGADWGLGHRPAATGEIDDPALAGLLGGPDECDVVVAHVVPEYWPLVRALYPGVPLAGHTVWETDRLPGHWQALIDEADLVVVPTAWNRELMERSGVRPPCSVVPHIAATPRAAESDLWSELPETAFVVYSIAAWTARKALGHTIRAYQSAFSGRDDTLLVLKTSPQDFSAPDAVPTSPIAPGTSAWALAQVLAEFPLPAPVMLVTRVLDERDLEALHTRGDCYLSLCRSEGWGIPPFDAAAWGNPVVITGFGGQLAYLGADSAFLVDHELVAVDDPAGAGSYSADQQWAEPSIEHGATLLRQVLADPAEAAARAERARRRVLGEFDAQVVGATFLRALAGARR
jgi:glycosyltransferase involved in cell wall biosynthesis